MTMDPNTLSARVAKLVKAQRYAAALLFAEKHAAVTASALGEEHPATIQAQANLGIVYLKAGDKLRAELRLRRALDAERRRANDQSPVFVRILDFLKRVAGEQALADQTAERLRSLAQRADAEVIKLACPACGESYDGPPLLRAQRVVCLCCDAEFDVPADDASRDTTQTTGNAGTTKTKTTSSAGPTGTTSTTEAPATPSVSEPGAIVASDSLDYSLALPTGGWIRMNQASEKEFGADVAVEHGNLGVLKIVTSEWNLSFEDLCEGIDEAYRQEVKQYHRINTTRVTVAGLPAMAIEYEGLDPESDEPMRMLSHVFVQGKTLFQAIAIGNPITFSALKREAFAALQSFSFDPARAAEHREKFPRQKSAWWRRLTNRPASMPSDMEALLGEGVRWAIGGGVVGVLFGLNSAGSAPGFFGKVVVFILWVFAGAFVGASFRWGRIAAYSGGGHQVLDKIIQALCLPLYPIEWMFSIIFRAPRGFAELFTNFYRLIAYPIGFVSAGCPYVVYVLVTRNTRLSGMLYVVFAVAGGVLGLMGISLLMYLGSLAYGGNPPAT
jgi:hypothetical protein